MDSEEAVYVHIEMFTVGRIACSFFVILGWIAILLGFVQAVFFLVEFVPSPPNGIQEYGIPAAILLFGGLTLIVLGQIGQAIFHNTNINSETLALMSRRQMGLDEHESP